MASIYSSSYNQDNYAVKYPKKDLYKYDSVYNEDNQQSVLISESNILEIYGPGSHALNKELIPSPIRLLGIPLGTNNLPSIELWFVNCKPQTNYKFEMKSVEVQDVFTRNILPLDFEVEYALEIINAENFIKYYVKHSGRMISQITLQNVHRDIFNHEELILKNTLRKFIEEEGLKIENGDSYLDQLSEILSEVVIRKLQLRGLRLTHLAIDKVSIALDMLSPLRKNLITKNLGLEGNIMIKRGLNLPPSLQNYRRDINLSIINKNISTSTSYTSLRKEPRIVVCGQCSSKHMSTEKFCPSCGKEFIPCPKCGRDTLENAKRCVGCGIPLKQMPLPIICHNCGGEVIIGSLFCPHCGEKQLSTNSDIKICGRCKTEASVSSKFCPNCGFKL